MYSRFILTITIAVLLLQTQTQAQSASAAASSVAVAPSTSSRADHQIQHTWDDLPKQPANIVPMIQLGRNKRPLERQQDQHGHPAVYRPVLVAPLPPTLAAESSKKMAALADQEPVQNEAAKQMVGMDENGRVKTFQLPVTSAHIATAPTYISNGHKKHVLGLQEDGRMKAIDLPMTSGPRPSLSHDSMLSNERQASQASQVSRVSQVSRISQASQVSQASHVSQSLGYN